MATFPMHSPSLSSQDPHIQRTFWRFALPSIAAMLVSGLYQIIDGIFSIKWKFCFNP